MVEKLYYKDQYLKEFDANIVNVKQENKKIKIYLDKTAFYPEGGGQPSDKGTIIGNGFEYVVDDVQKEGNEIAHIGHLVSGKKISTGPVKCHIDWSRRYDFMQQHTGHHILAATILRVLNSHVFGSVISEDLNKIEFKYNGELSESIKKIETISNGVIWSSMKVESEIFNSTEELKELPLRKQPKEGLKNSIRIVKIGNYDMVPCAGTHVKNTSEVGVLKIMKFYKKNKDVWRIEFACGFRALNTMNKILDDYSKISLELNEKPYNIADKITDKLEEFEDLKKELNEVKSKLIESKMTCENGLCSYFGSLNMKEMESISIDAINKGSKIAALASENGYLIVTRNKDFNFDVRKIYEKIKKEFGGNGGGSPSMIRMGGINDIKVAFDYVLSLLRDEL